jgi:hypothetical protein
MQCDYIVFTTVVLLRQVIIRFLSLGPQVFANVGLPWNAPNYTEMQWVTWGFEGVFKSISFRDFFWSR